MKRLNTAYGRYYLGLALILVGYFLPWLPNPAAGLSFIGLEIGEWVKFVPQVQMGEITPGRDLFYLPPITTGLILALLTAGWPNRRWQTWAMRGLAILVSLLAFPSLDAIRFEPASEWQARLLLVGLVMLVALLSSVLGTPGRGRRLIPYLITLVALLGASLPTWTFLAMLPAIRTLLGPVAAGPGLWLNLAGHLWIAGLALAHSRPPR